jgi:GNAT superfamily N-acetyltransferase
MTAVLVTALRPEDRERWTVLWRAYLDFYETSLPAEIYQHTWRRLLDPDGPIYGFGARCDSAAAPLVGIAHYLFHPHAWSPKEVCYLQDLFVDPLLRGKGIGRALIEHAAAAARARNCLRLYWTTKEDNAVARQLYDRLAQFKGFIRYDYAQN